MIGQILFYVFAFLVALELFIHILYFNKTGKGGLYDPPFDYLSDIFNTKGEHR